MPLILLTLLATAYVMPMLFSAALGIPLLFRVVLAVVLLAPLGILLGMPFPMGLRIVYEEASALVPWSWGVNGFFTAIGTGTVLILGMPRCAVLFTCGRRRKLPSQHSALKIW